jgi:hypothetical protein
MSIVERELEAALEACVFLPEDERERIEFGLQAALIAPPDRLEASIFAAAREILAVPEHGDRLLEHLARALNACFGDVALDALPEGTRPPTRLIAARGTPRAHPVPGVVFRPVPDEDDVIEDDDDEDDEDELVLEELAGEAPDEAARARFLAERDPDDGAFAALDADVGAALATANAANDQLADFDAAPGAPGVEVTVGAAVPFDAFVAEAVSSACDTLAGLARDRALLPMRARAAVEQRILDEVDAVLAFGAAAVAPLATHGAAARDELGDPWAIWGPLFAFGCIEGREALAAIAHIVARLPADDLDGIAVASEALAVAPHPDLGKLAALLGGSRAPAARAVALDLQTRRGGFDPDRLARALDDPNEAVVHAALRTLTRAPALYADLVPTVRARVRHPSPAVSLAAARLALLWGDRSPYQALRRGDALALTRLPHGLEVFVLAGEDDDLPRIEKHVRRLGPSATVFDALGRFGHARSWAYLGYHLEQEDHAGAAAGALERIFGALVAPEQRTSSGAWKRALTTVELDEGVRYRDGAPWRAERVLAAATSGEHARVATARLLDELRVRARAVRPLDLAGWSPQPENELASFAAAVAVEVHRLPSGCWL